MTFQRNRVWQNDLTLWTDVLKKSPNKSRPYESLGIAYMQRDEFLPAMNFFNQALERNPKSVKALNNRGLLNHKLRDGMKLFEIII